MNIRNWFKKSASTNTKQIVVPANEFNSYIYGQSSFDRALTDSIALQYYDDSPAIATAIDLITNPIEQMNLVIYDNQEQKNIESSQANDLLSFLRQPNGFQGQAEFIGDVTRHYLITGKAWIWLLGTGKPQEIHDINPVIVSTVLNSQDNYSDYYMIQSGIGQGQYNRVEKAKELTRFISISGINELYQIARYSNHIDKTTGSSPLEAISKDIRLQLQGRIHNVKLLEAGGRLSLLIVFHDDTPPIDAVIKQRDKLIKERISGVENTGKIAQFSSSDGIDIKNMNISNQDMDYANLEKMASNSIYNRFGIPLALIDLTGSTFSNVEASIPYFFHSTVLPVANKIFSNLSKCICPRFGLDSRRFKITYDINKINQLEKYILENLELRRKTGIETTNELRAQLKNRPPVTNGDEVLIGVNQVPLSSVFDNVGL